MGRLVLTQKGRDLRRVVASLTAYLAIAALAVGVLWLIGTGFVIVAQSLVGA